MPLATLLDPTPALWAALAGQYEFMGEIGQGGMATVYLARDVRHSSKVAIKVLRPELAALTGGARFTREIQITASLQHPSILPLLGSGEAAGIAYYVMPFVEGESLAQRLKRETRLPLDEAVRLVAEVADGLAHAHAAGFVHRDIKPANILLSHGHAIIADFGVAHALETSAFDRLTDSGLALGTATYMSPEQAGADHVDGRSDIYSLGLVLYEMLAGAPPFTGPSAQAIMARNAVDPVPSIRTVRQAVPQALEAALNKALAKVPEDRFTTAAAFRDEIVRAATMPVTAEIAPPSARAWWRRGPVVIAAGSMVLVATLGVWHLTTAVPILDANRVMVYPFVLPDRWPGARSAGEDVATVIGSAMDGAGSLRWVDGWQLLRPAQRENIRLLGVGEAMSIARSKHCAFAITGTLVARGDSVDVFLTLYDVRGDSIVARVPARSGPITESWRGGMRAVTEILPRLIPAAEMKEASSVQAEWKARPPQAVAHFLVGEAAFRRLRLTDAFAEYVKAVEADSTFGLAALRGAQLASWKHDTKAAASLIRLAVRQPLSPRYRFIAGGFQAFLDGRADSAAAQLRAALALDSSMTVAWAQLGEVYMHLLPQEGSTDSLGEAAFVRALALDSTAANLQYHLVEILARRGDQAGSVAMAKRFAKVAVDTMFLRQVELVSSCGRGGFMGLDLHEAAVRRPLPLSIAAKYLGASRFTSQCALAADEMLLRVDTAKTDAADGRRFFALLGLVSLQLSRGNSGAAIDAIEQFRQRWGHGLSLYLLAAPVVPALAGRARDVARQDSITHGAGYAKLAFPVRLWELGVWAAEEENARLAREVADRLAARAVRGTRLDSLLAESMAGHAALAEGDSLQALQRFDRLIAQASPVGEITWIEPASLGFDRITLGRLLISRKAYARALGVLDVLDSAMPAIYPLYLRASLELRVKAAIGLRQDAVVAMLRTRLAALSGG